MLTDRYGNQLSTSSEDARDAYVEAIDRMLAGDGDVEGPLAAAVAADQEFALAHVATARQHHLMARGKEARATIEVARELARTASAREQRHTEIYAAIISGQVPKSLELTKAHLAEHPRDAFVVAPASGVFGSIGFSGRIDRTQEQLDFIAPLADDYGDDWWYLTAHAFALGEVGDWAKGRELAERALELRPDSAHAAHTLAHVLYEAGADDEALSFMNDWVPSADPRGILHCHIWWHYAVLLVGTGRLDDAWEAFSNNCLPGQTTSPDINVFTDASSFLWRGELAGMPRRDDAWQRVRDHYEASFRKPIVFVDCHAGLPYAALGDADTLDATAELLGELAEQGRLPAGTFGQTVARAYGAYAAGDWGAVIDILEPAMAELPRIGGSRAQSDLVTNTLLAAYMHDGRADAVAALLDREHDELHRRPSHAVAGLAA